eukprot:TRINITY_DN1562_c0_g1_i3.p1 TRINITY_DN1562_c0_g1~~TRINITY_DN1562_c0_g1_i3.p1  ORF type:complete len:159 (+),score=20.59 TRINITY_DN1562_c0_g1_i3:46-522(+)
MGEVITFKIPAEENTLFISNLSPTTEEEDIRSLLSQVGLVHSVKIFTREMDNITGNIISTPNHPTQPSMTNSTTTQQTSSDQLNTSISSPIDPNKHVMVSAFAKFYSLKDARNARQQLHGALLKGSKIRVIHTLMYTQQRIYGPNRTIQKLLLECSLR